MVLPIAAAFLVIIGCVCSSDHRINSIDEIQFGKSIRSLGVVSYGYKKLMTRPNSKINKSGHPGNIDIRGFGSLEKGNGNRIPDKTKNKIKKNKESGIEEKHGYFPSKKTNIPKRKKIYEQVADTSPISATGGCPHGWLPYGGSCYLFSRENLNWFHAMMKCQFYGGYLAVVNSPHENSYLKTMAHKNPLRRGIWIGLNDILFPASHTWYWGNGYKKCDWFDWFDREPIFNRYKKGNCVTMRKRYQYQWHVDKCKSKHFYVCEINPEGPCICNN